jgi:hypothetical protein
VSIEKYLRTGKLEVARYSPRKNLSKDHVSFSGVPRKHPYDEDKLLLIADPFSLHAVFYEFNLTDIVHVEELPSVVNEGGESARTARVWVKKGSFGLRYEPFRVEDTGAFMETLGRPRRRSLPRRS